MFNNEKGFSLIILIVAIVVVVIITSTAIITIKSISSDRAISEFMNDLSDVKQFVIEYYGRDGTLPIKETEANASDELLEIMSGDSALYQISDEDGGNYFYVDLERLGKIHLTDSNRGYILNENSLNIYVTKPIRYEGTNYYTLTKNLTGRELIVNSEKGFEISITGNPIKWTTKADILVSITDKRFNSGDEVNWVFKWLKGSKTADDFKTSNEAHYFTYGDLITFTENGIYTIYVEGPDARPIIRRVVISKIDNIKPKVRIEDGIIIIDDAETGVKSIRCKIKETDRANINTATRERYPDIYMMNREQITDTEESLLESYLWGSRNLKGDTINDYLKDFDDYYRQFVVFNNVIASIDSTSGEIENAQSGLRALNSNYPQFAYDNKMFGNSEKNIVLYVEDMCGNATVYSAISRNELKALQYVSSDVGTLSDIKLVINNNAEYTNDRNVQLFLQAMYAESYFVTEEKVNTPVWRNFDTSRDNFIVSDGSGEKIIYAFFKDANGKIKSTYDKIYLDEDAPTKTAPTVSRTPTSLSIRSNQKDAESGIASVMYGIMESTGLSYTWYQRVSDIPDLDISKTYKIVTKCTDKAGNSTISAEVVSAISESIMIAKDNEKGFWQSPYKEKITSIQFKKGSTGLPNGAIDLGNMATNTDECVIRAYVQDDGTGNGTYKCTVVSAQTIYANTNLSAYFRTFTNLEEIDFSNFNTEKVTRMDEMFSGSSKLTSLDLSSFNTSSVTKMNHMFMNCNALTELDVSSFNTENVDTMGSMFLGCNHMTYFDLRNFNTAKVTTMSHMFYACSELVRVDMSGFDTTSLTDTTNMFKSDSKLQTIYVGNRWNKTPISTSDTMFINCLSLVGGSGTAYNEDHVDKDYAQIDGGLSNPGYFSSRY